MRSNLDSVKLLGRRNGDGDNESAGQADAESTVGAFDDANAAGKTAPKGRPPPRPDRSGADDYRRSQEAPQGDGRTKAQS